MEISVGNIMLAITVHKDKGLKIEVSYFKQ